MYYNSELSIDENKKKILTLGIICILLMISPIVSLFFSILFYRQKISYLFFVLFAFYFGWFYEPQLDLLIHYEHFITLIGENLLDAWTDIETQHIGKEPYPVLFKYIVGQISTTPNFFSACACTIYAILFSYGVLGSIRDLYILKKTLLAWILFIGIIFVVEYNWFLGFRYWSGVFFFVSFYIRYVRTSRKKYLLLSFLCACFHFSLLTLCVATILNELLKNKFKVRYLLVIIGWIIRYMQIPITTYITQLSIMDGIVKDTSRNESIIENVAQRMEYFRTEGNFFYMIRDDFLFIGACLVLFFLWSKFGKQVVLFNSKLWGLIIILYAIANIGYVDLIFYSRFYKVAILFFYIYLFVSIMRVQNKINILSRCYLAFLSSIPILYSISTIVISQREYFWRIELWFNNIFF